MALFIYYIVTSFTFYIYPFCINHNDHCEKLTVSILLPYTLSIYIYKIANRGNSDFMNISMTDRCGIINEISIDTKHFIQGNNE
jgi:hypothetical protein